VVQTFRRYGCIFYVRNAGVGNQNKRKVIGGALTSESRLLLRVSGFRRGPPESSRSTTSRRPWRSSERRRGIRVLTHGEGMFSDRLFLGTIPPVHSARSPCTRPMSTPSPTSLSQCTSATTARITTDGWAGSRTVYVVTPTGPEREITACPLPRHDGHRPEVLRTTPTSIEGTTIHPGQRLGEDLIIIWLHPGFCAASRIRGANCVRAPPTKGFLGNRRRVS